MALEYQLVISTDSSIKSLLEVVHQHSSLVWSADHTFLTGTGVQVSGIASSRSRQATIKEGFGFRPEAQLFFRMASDPEERRVGYRVMLEVVVDFLQREGGRPCCCSTGKLFYFSALPKG